MILWVIFSGVCWNVLIVFASAILSNFFIVILVVIEFKTSGILPIFIQVAGGKQFLLFDRFILLLLKAKVFESALICLVLRDK